MQLKSNYGKRVKFESFVTAKVEKAGREGAQRANDLDYIGLAKKNVVNSYRFSALNLLLFQYRSTNQHTYATFFNFNRL